MPVTKTLIGCAAIIAFGFPGIAPAQTPPAFEVAVIKPSLPMAQAIPLLMQGKLKAAAKQVTGSR